MPAFVFPGQGAQRPGMGTPWLEHPSWEVVQELSAAADRDIGRLLTEAGEEELTETRNAQVATFTFSLLVLDAVERLGIEPTRLAGHSVGEYTALAASGALGFEESIRLVAERGDAMQAAADASNGVMTVIAGCEADMVDIACRLADGNVWVANFNSVDETVIAGDPPSVERAASVALDMGARRATPVRVGGAFHTPFMAPARDRLRKMLSTITLHDPDTPVVANVDSRFHTRGEDWKVLLSAQLCSPIRWHQSVMRLAGLDDANLDVERTFIELGPGDSLCAMIRHTLPAATTLTVSTPADLDSLVEVLTGDDALHAYAVDHQGELLYVSERVVISPTAGIFEPPPGGLTPGDRIEVGTLLGSVAGEDVLAPFAGRLEGCLAQPGERVQAGQPIVWLHTA
ncbi:MAG TPA: acyltransferase domain-containing protein [Acidimicrobiales bacterium]|nr:acyltransferase domain-containing protein [Acidimicrobiales bacterium]